MRTVTASQLRSGNYKGSGFGPNIPPLYSIEIMNKDEETGEESFNSENITDWLMNACQELQSIHDSFVWDQEKRRQLYVHGTINPNTDRSNFSTQLSARDSRPGSQFSINKTYNAIETWVSKITKWPATVVVNPTQSEYADKQGAKLGNLVCDNLAYVNKTQDKAAEIARHAFVDGEVFATAEWDSDFGDESEEGRAVEEVMDSEGNPVTSEEGAQLYKTVKESQGEVNMGFIEARYIMLEPKLKYEDIDWYIKIDPVYVDEAKCLYPDYATEFQGGSSGPIDWPWVYISEQETLRYTIKHRSTSQFPGGVEIVVIGDTVVEVTPYKLKNQPNKLDIVRYTDRDLMGVLRGSSRIDSIAIAQICYNNLWSIAYTNTSLAAHAYWLVPTQSNTKTEAIRNGAAIIHYTGVMAPKLETFKTVGGEVLNMMDRLEKIIETGMGHQGISQGEPPPGVDAAIALGLLEEQENQRAGPEIKKFNSFIAEWFKLALARAQDNYRTEDERLLRIVGRGNTDTIKSIEMTRFAGPYDVRIEKSTGLSHSKNLRLQQLMLIRQNFPQSLSDERFLSLMEMSDDKKLYDIVTAATDCAESENDDFSSGDPVELPRETDDHIAHLNVHYPHIQTAGFKEDVPPDVQKEELLHIHGHEWSVYRQAWTNLAIAQKLSEMPQFPRVLKIDIPVALIPQLVQSGMDYETARVMRQQALMQAGAPPPTAPTGEPPISEADIESAGQLGAEGVEDSATGALGAMEGEPMPNGEQVMGSAMEADGNVIPVEQRVMSRGEEENVGIN